MENNKQKLQTTLENLLSISDEYYLDYYIENYRQSLWANLSNKQKIIIDTIEKYKEHHENFEEHRIKHIFDYFEKIVKNDKVIYFQETFIYKELYKILYIIDRTFQAQKLLNDSESYPSGFAQIQSDLKKVKSFRNHYKDNLIGLYKIVGKGQSRFRYWFATIYINNKTLAKFFTHLFLRADLVRVKDFHKDEKVSELLLNELEFLLMQRTSISKVIKSFGILFYWELIEYLGIHKNSAEEYASHIIYELFKENFNAEELHKIIEIKSSLDFFPIFGASKKLTLAENEIKFISDKMFKELNKLSSITKEQFEPLFDSYIKNPHIQFLRKYPVELFRINTKYSSIN